MDDSTIICRCEEVTLGDVKRAIEAGLIDPSDIRKYTRAGMGACQGRTCQRILMQAIKQNGLKASIAEETIHTRTPIQQMSVRELATWE